MSNTITRTPGKFAPGDRVKRRGPASASSSYRVSTRPFIVETTGLHGQWDGWVYDAHGGIHNPENLEHAPLVSDLHVRERELTTTLQARVAEDVVNNPSHYQSNGLEAIDVLEAFGLTRDGRLFNVGKYILRAGKKDAELQDLKKARWYLDRLINDLEKAPTK